MSFESGASNRNECIHWSDYKHTMRTAAQQISVILPAYNEEISVESMVYLTKLYADKVIVVDDGSWNRTAEVARKAGAELIVHKINKEKGVALKTGFETFRFNAQGMDIKSKMLADVGNAGLRIKEVGTDVRYDVDGSTKKTSLSRS